MQIAIGNFLLILLLLAFPIFIPFSSLVLPSQVLGYFLPPTYAAEALRLALTSDFNSNFYLDLGMLIAFILVSFFLITAFFTV